MEKIDKLYINSASTRILQRYKNDFIQYKDQIFPNNSHVHLRDCDATSSYNLPSKITGSKIPEWECILNCCYDFPRMNATYLE